MTAVTLLDRVRIHEAGHAIIAAMNGVQLERIEVRTVGDRRGGVWHRPLDRRSARLSEISLVIAFAGDEAERLAAGEWTREPKLSADESDASDIADRLVRLRGSGSRYQILRDGRRRAAALVNRHWEAIAHLAASLEASGDVLDGLEVDHAIAAALEARVWRGASAEVPAPSFRAERAPLRPLAVASLANRRHPNVWRELVAFASSYGRGRPARSIIRGPSR